MTMARKPLHSTQEAEMASEGRNDETAAERVVRDIEAHENRVAERLLGQVYATLRESFSALEARIAETRQMQAHAATRVVEDKVGAMLGRHTDTLLQATKDASSTVQGHINTSVTTLTHGLDAKTERLLQAAKDASGAVQDHINTSVTTLKQGFDTKTDTLLQATKDASSTVQGHIDTSVATLKQGLDTKLDAQLSTVDQRVKETETAMAEHVDQNMVALIPQLRDMLNTTEVSVIAKILSLIDARLKAIEARLSGYSGPEQEREEKEERERLAKVKKDQAAELTKIALAADTEAKSAPENVKLEYEYLASRANELAAQATREAEELLA